MTYNIKNLGLYSNLIKIVSWSEYLSLNKKYRIDHTQNKKPLHGGLLLRLLN